MATPVGSAMMDAALGALLGSGTSGRLRFCCSISNNVVAEHQLALESGPAIALEALLPIVETDMRMRM
jgi:hypothetical protein